MLQGWNPPITECSCVRGLPRHGGLHTAESRAKARWPERSRQMTNDGETCDVRTQQWSNTLLQREKITSGSMRNSLLWLKAHKAKLLL
ncbi:hypothetical protein EYF80_046090 [Liparis tanakae]|uniref:Uncharacterized protein n=1 Tax=Liparis tanakae TaxID=230148 RepID=A0A4Z2FR34_9TELE|nr:hypothetical protein EYF80_046090 [Liparis tanakae]